MNPWTLATAIYRLYAFGDRLLYVGMTNSPEHRFEQHASDKPWWWEVSRIELAWFPNRWTAEAEEEHVIWAENPLYNKQRIVDWQPRRHERRCDMKSVAQSIVDLGFAKSAAREGLQP